MRSAAPNDLRLRHLPANPTAGDALIQVQGDDFHVTGPVENSTRKKSFCEDSDASKTDSDHECEPNHDATEDDHVEQQVRQIVAFGQMSIFIPGNIGFVTH